MPLIAPLGVLFADPGNTYTVMLNLSDEDTPAELLAVSTESLDPEKVTVLGLEGSGAKRSLSIAVSDFFQEPHSYGCGHRTNPDVVQGPS